MIWQTNSCSRVIILMICLFRKGEKMDQSQFNKIKSVLAFMDDKYWSSVAADGKKLSDELEKNLITIKDIYTKSTIIQLHILNAKYKGYERLIQNTDESAVDKIIADNKDGIDMLIKQKQQYINEFQWVLSGLIVFIEKIKILGEH